MVKPTVIVSDLHLGAVPEAVPEAFIRFLRHWHGRAETLLINGDLFDFWFEYRTVVLSQHFQVLRALAELRESGVRLILVGGNHDAWGGAFLEREIGVDLAQGPVELELAGRRALVAHGDGMGPGETAYKILRGTLRSRPLCRAMRWIHPDLSDRIVRHISQTGKRSGDDDRQSVEVAKRLEEYAVKLLEERADLDLIVFAHCHIPRVRAAGTHGYYVNSGDWVKHRTYTLLTEDEIDQREWVEA
ncbi:MAG: UDP-2,3-diacylglucosamine diphosphatase [Gemmatimonadota bacterium]|nr:MAG: UDP-2,3-diacylglucosamine diphosphatase [Gemmatimonadota bacterium]